MISIIAIGLTYLFLSIGNEVEISENTKVAVSNLKTPNECKEHVYDGKEIIKVWQVDESDTNLLVQVDPSDIDKLPEPEHINDIERNDFKIGIIDADQNLVKKLENSSAQKPVTITISGYKSFCEKLPLASLQSGEKAFL